jgi:hypothetical protein
MAAHPQQDEKPADAEAEVQPAAVKNPFPAQMTVPGPDGEDVTVELAVVDGIVYAPGLDELPLDPGVRQYVTQYCAAWTSSVLTTGRIAEQWPSTPPRRAQLVFREASLHAMLGLAGDERLCRIDVDQLKGEVRFVVESPRLPPMPYWDGGPPIITLPVAAHYEPQQVAR